LTHYYYYYYYYWWPAWWLGPLWQSPYHIHYYFVSKFTCSCVVGQIIHLVIIVRARHI